MLLKATTSHLIQIILPEDCSTILGTIALANAAPEKKFTCISLSSTEMSVSKKDDRDEMPPLFISISIFFVACNCCAIEREFFDRLPTEILSAKSHVKISIFIFDCSYKDNDAIFAHSFLTCCKASSSLPLSMRSDTLHSANLCANDRPRPRDAPVIKIDLSWNRSLVCSDRALLLLADPILRFVFFIR